MADRPPIELLAPLGSCPVEDPRPTFSWRVVGSKLNGRLPRDPIRPDPSARWRLRLWVMPAGGDAEVVMAAKPLIDERIEGRPVWKHPTSMRPLGEGAAYLWTVDSLDSRGRAAVSSAPGLFYVDAGNGFPMAQWLCCGDDGLLSEDISAWKPVLGSPGVDDKGDGCHESVGLLSLGATPTSVDAVSQQLPPGQLLQAGRHYQISFCARATAPRGIRFRLYAHNGSLPNTGGAPEPSGALIPIDETSVILGKEWTWVVLLPWCPPRDFNRLAIVALAPPSDSTGGGEASGEISNICMREVDGCRALVAPGSAGSQLQFGDGVEVDPAGPAEAQAVTTALGPMTDLFGAPFTPDGANNWYSAANDCASIGGWIPDDLDEHVPWLEPDVELFDPEELADAFLKLLGDLKNPTIVEDLPPIELKLEDCDGWDPAPHPRDLREPIPDPPPPPFAGRDIVYVHGFVLSQVLARIVADDQTLLAAYNAIPSVSLVPPAMVANVAREWPDDPAPYRADLDDGQGGTIDGHFRDFAEREYWGQHVGPHIVDAGHPNRYMAVGYNCSQRLVYSVHAVLAQIAQAMSTGEGVRDPKGERGRDCFGKEYVIVSHSTGALVTNVALAVAAATATNQTLRDIYGDISEIAHRAKVHISMHGALGGSEIAQAAVVGAGVWGGHVIMTDIAADAATIGAYLMSSSLAETPQQQAEVDSFFAAITATENAAAAAALTVSQVVFASVLVDLSPMVTKTVWASEVGSSPVPTLTVAGGHPSFGGLPGFPVAGGVIPTYFGKLALPGLDDGVVNANSQSGSNSLPNLDVYAYLPPKANVFDMGIPPERSAVYFAEQVKGPFAAYASIPFLSPSGMVQPVMAVPVVPRFQNVHPFLQAASEHSFTAPLTTPPTPAAFPSGDYEDTGVANNYEESLVIESPIPFTSGLVDPVLAALVVRYMRRLDVTLSLTVQIPSITLFPPSFNLTTVTIRITLPVWRRFYDLITPPGTVLPASSPVIIPVSTGVTVTIAPWPIPDPVETALAAPTNLSEIDYSYRYVVPV